jgi:hypothetical protein
VQGSLVSAFGKIGLLRTDIGGPMIERFTAPKPTFH